MSQEPLPILQDQCARDCDGVTPTTSPDPHKAHQVVGTVDSSFTGEETETQSSEVILRSHTKGRVRTETVPLIVLLK